MSAAQFYCQTCKTKAVVTKSNAPDHCAGNYPFQCCCLCAVAAGWKGWADDGCAQCKACATSTTPHASLSSEESDDEEAVGFAVTIVEAEEDLGAVGFVNRRGESRMHADYDIFTFQSLRKRTSFMKAKAAAMHAKVGAIAVDNADDDQDGAASASTSAQHAASHVPLEDAKLEVLCEGWLLKQSKTLKMWHKKYFVLDSVALYWAKSPHDVPDGFFPVRKCQFLQQPESGTFEVITSGGGARMQVLRHKTAQGQKDLDSWTKWYTAAMNDTAFPYFHVHQTCRRDLSMELLLGVCKNGLRLVKLGLYDPGREEEIAYFSFSEIYEWGCPDIETFEFCATCERVPYELKTLHASDIEAMIVVKFHRWKEARAKSRTSARPAAIL